MPSIASEEYRKKYSSCHVEPAWKLTCMLLSQVVFLARLMCVWCCFSAGWCRTWRLEPRHSVTGVLVYLAYLMWLNVVASGLRVCSNLLFGLWWLDVSYEHSETLSKILYVWLGNGALWLILSTLDLKLHTYLLTWLFTYLVVLLSSLALALCGLRGCKNWPIPFPGRMSYKATKPGLALSVVYLSMFYCIVVY